jgi:large subunit ribosomal protein L25
LQIGAQITAADLSLPTGSALAGDPEHVLLVIAEASAEEPAAEAETAAGAEDGGPAADASAESTDD